MKMTKEEAIAQIEKLKSYCDYMKDGDENRAYFFDLDVQALDFVLSTLTPPTEYNNVSTKAPNESLTLDELREMDGEPVWVEEVEHWALIDIEKGGQWAGVPFAVWEENGANFTYNIEDRELHCFRRPPEEGAKNKNIPTNEPLTLEEVSLMIEPTPVWWDWVQGWVLARKGMIISWNGVYYNFEEVKGNFYRCPPEEPLTCEGCVHEINEHENCNYCIRAGSLNDYYCRRTPEGEEET